MIWHHDISRLVTNSHTTHGDYFEELKMSNKFENARSWDSHSETFSLCIDLSIIGPFITPFSRRYFAMHKAPLESPFTWFIVKGCTFHFNIPKVLDNALSIIPSTIPPSVSWHDLGTRDMIALWSRDICCVFWYRVDRERAHYYPRYFSSE